MNHIDLKIEVRSSVGKGAARKLRSSDRVPGVYYGPHVKTPLGVSVDRAEFSRVRTKMGTNSLLNLQADASSPLAGKMALIKNVQVDPVSDKSLHIDFYEINENEPLKVLIPLSLVGKAVGTAEGGILEQVRRDIEVKSLPKDIPSKIEVDITSLNVGESIHVKDLKLPAGVTVVGNVNFTIVTIVPPEKEEVKAAAAGAAETVVATDAKKAEKTEDKK